MTFQLADLGFHVELFSKPHSSCWKWGCWIWGFFPPHLPSPGAGLLISSGRTGRHTIPTMALSLWKKTPVAFVKVLGGVRVLTTSQPFFFFFPKKGKKKNSTQHTVSSQTISDRNSGVAEAWSHGSLRQAPVFEKQKRGDCSACSSSSRSSLDEFLKAAGMERVGQRGLFTPFVKTAGQRGSRRPGAIPRQDLLTAGP